MPDRGDGAVPNTNGDVAVAAGSAISKHVFMIAIDTVGIHTLRGDRGDRGDRTAVLNVDVDVSFTQMMAIDAVRLGAKDVGINIRAFRRDGDTLNVDVDVAGGIAVGKVGDVILSYNIVMCLGNAFIPGIDAVAQINLRGDAAVSGVDVDVAGGVGTIA